MLGVYRNTLPWPMWTAVRTKDSHTKKSATTNHTPPLHRVFKNALLKTFKEFGVLRESHPSPCMALQETFLCSEVPHFNVFDFTVHWAHELVSGNTRNFKASLLQLHSSHMLVKSCSKFSKPGCSNMWTINFQMFKLVLEKAEEPEIQIANILWIMEKAKAFQ